MGREIFIDTGAWFALSDVRDQYHKRALQCYRVLREQRQQLITTNLVITEAFAFDPHFLVAGFVLQPGDVS